MALSPVVKVALGMSALALVLIIGAWWYAGASYGPLRSGSCLISSEFRCHDVDVDYDEETSVVQFRAILENQLTDTVTVYSYARDTRSMMSAVEAFGECSVGPGELVVPSGERFTYTCSLRYHISLDEYEYDSIGFPFGMAYRIDAGSESRVATGELVGAFR